MGKEEVNKHVAPGSSSAKDSGVETRYASPISQPGKPSSLSIPAPLNYEPRSFKDEVGDMLAGNSSPPPAAEDTGKQVGERIEAAKSAAPPTRCAKCNFKLSSLDVKMGQCLKCGAAVGPDSGRDRPSRGSITIGI